MKPKTPPGLYFTMVIAALAVAFSSGITKSPVLQEIVPPQAIQWGDERVGVYLTSYAILKPSVMIAVREAREAGMINALVINVKNMHGELTYSSKLPLAQALGASTGRLDFERLLAALRSEGFYLIARQVVFYDPLLAEHLGLHGAWVPADDPLAREYNLAIAEEVAALGFDELQLDYIRYADGGDLLPIYEDRYTAVTSFVADVRAQLPRAIRLSADLFGRVLWPWNTRRIDPIGQSLEDLSAILDYVSPMVYPSHYYEQAYRDDPYRTVKDALTSGTARVGARIRPFLQAFDRHLPQGMTLEVYIAEQIRAAGGYGADGFLFWHPACDYAPLFRVLEPRIP